jgi:hypothetical protein
MDMQDLIISRITLLQLRFCACPGGAPSGDLYGSSLFEIAVVVVVVTVGLRPRRVETPGQLAEHCVETLRGDGATLLCQAASLLAGPSGVGGPGLYSNTIF